MKFNMTRNHIKKNHKQENHDMKTMKWRKKDAHVNNLRENMRRKMNVRTVHGRSFKFELGGFMFEDDLNLS